MDADGRTGRGGKISKQFLCRGTERPHVGGGGVSVRSRNSAPRLERNARLMVKH